MMNQFMLNCFSFTEASSISSKTKTTATHHQQGDA